MNWQDFAAPGELEEVAGVLTRLREHVEKAEWEMAILKHYAITFSRRMVGSEAGRTANPAGPLQKLLDNK